MPSFRIDRRGFLRAAGASASLLTLSGCDAFDGVLGADDRVRNVLEKANDLTWRIQNMLTGEAALAPEYSESEIRQPQRPNGSTDPQTDDYVALKSAGFSGYTLTVKGLVEQPRSFTLDELRAMPARTQITRHDCVEGWSCIAKWTGVPLAHVLAETRVKAQARYVLFDCYDSMGDTLAGPDLYYETIDLQAARHPQTILAYGLNGQTLSVENGAPLRLRVEQQLGYKMAKYIRSITLIDDFSRIKGGKGGFWEDNGYDWYAGI